MKKSSPIACHFLLSGEPAIGSKVKMEVALPDVLGAENSMVHCEGTIVAVTKVQKGKTRVSCTIDRLNLEPSTPG